MLALPAPKGDKRLVAYVVAATTGAPDFAKVRERLNERLPDYMVPSLWFALPSLPLTPNGKIDRNALPLPEAPSETPSAAQRVDEAIAEIFKSTLGVAEVGLDDDFFDLGGTSLGLINAVTEISKRLAIALDTSIVTGGATVRWLAYAVSERLAGAAERNFAAEDVIADIWRSVLGLNEVDLDDDFFDLGGTSLALINAVTEMSKRLAVPLGPSIVIDGATVRSLAKAVRDRMPRVNGLRSAAEDVVADIWKSTLGIDRSPQRRLL